MGIILFYHRDWGIISKGWYGYLDGQGPVDLRQ